MFLALLWNNNLSLVMSNVPYFDFCKPAHHINIHLAIFLILLNIALFKVLIRFICKSHLNYVIFVIVLVFKSNMLKKDSINAMNI